MSHFLGILYIPPSKQLTKETQLQVLGLWLLVQSLSFIVAGASVTALLVYDDLKATSFPVFMALVIVTNVSGALAALSTLAGTILIEREWYDGNISSSF
jgi:iron-regulated transporter 1